MPLFQPSTMMQDEPEPYGYEHGPMGEMGEPPHMGEVIPFPIEPPAHVVKLQRQMMTLLRLTQQGNVADVLEEDERNKIGSTVCREYKIDDESRSDWREMADRAMAIAKQKKEAKNYPWEGASNVKYPLLTTAALQFAARAYPAIVDGPRIVKAAVLGRDQNGAKAAMADRVSQHMSYQLLYEIPGWESDMDTCLHQIPIVGCAFKKVYEDANSEAGLCSDLVSAFDFVVHQNTKNLRTVPRATHIFKLYPHEIDERRRDGRFLDLDFKSGADDNSDEQSPHTFLEQHRFWDIDGDGVVEPWIITVHKETERVVRIKPCFDPNNIVTDVEKGKIIKIPREEYWVKIPFIPDPEGGFYDVGFGKLLEAVSDVVDTTINQMIDAGTLQNAGGGFIGGGMQLGKARIQLRPGQYQVVQSAGDDIRKSIVNMEHPGPAPVLFQVLELMIEAGKDIASVKDVLTGDTPTNQTATSTMAAIEQGLKVFTAIYKRIFRALKDEYRLIFEINKRTLQMPKYVALLDIPVEVIGADYHDDIDVMPVSDPNTVTDMQRMAKAQFVLEEAKSGNPHINLFEATKRAMEAARIDAPEEVLVPPNPQPPPEAEIALADGAAGVDLKKAQTVKTIADATVALAQVGMPVSQPMPVAEPQFMGGPMDMMGAPPEEQMPPDMMGMPEIPPPGLDPSQIPPEQLAEMAAMMGGGMPPQPEAAPVPEGFAGLA